MYAKCVVGLCPDEVSGDSTATQGAATTTSARISPQCDVYGSTPSKTDNRFLQTLL